MFICFCMFLNCLGTVFEYFQKCLGTVWELCWNRFEHFSFFIFMCFFRNQFESLSELVFVSFVHFLYLVLLLCWIVSEVCRNFFETCPELHRNLFGALSELFRNCFGTYFHVFIDVSFQSPLNIVFKHFSKVLECIYKLYAIL